MQHPVVSQEEWLTARRALLAKEKQLTRQRDQLSAERRKLPWVRIDKPYVFDGPGGKATLADLFDGRSQLVIQHFMFGPDWEEGCVGCSFGADHVDAARLHFEHRDLSFAAVSRAPLAKIEAFRRRMGWRFPWVSSLGSDFNYDFNVSFTKDQLVRGKVSYNYELVDSQSEDLSGISLFYKDESGAIFHTYSTYGRGDELLSTAYMYLDLAPRGRDEEGLPFPSAWWRHHDKYEDARPQAASCCASEPKRR
ncbi:MAG TPA: thioredoxin family protein [Dongiaceae bacterium]